MSQHAQRKIFSVSGVTTVATPAPDIVTPQGVEGVYIDLIRTAGSDGSLDLRMDAIIGDGTVRSWVTFAAWDFAFAGRGLLVGRSPFSGSGDMSSAISEAKRAYLPPRWRFFQDLTGSTGASWDVYLHWLEA